ncbi:MAG: hypothetical protein ACRDF4_09345 [Rhabdochlamydiaceae bacterium]
MHIKVAKNQLETAEQGFKENDIILPNHEDFKFTKTSNWQVEFEEGHGRYVDRLLLRTYLLEHLRLALTWQVPLEMYNTFRQRWISD